MLLLPTVEQHSDVAASEERFDRRISLFAAHRHGVFSRAEALTFGATRGLIQRRVATSVWDVLYPGVYRLAGAPETWRQRLRAACLVAGQGAVASHRSAGLLKALPRMPEGIIEVTVPNSRRLRRPGIFVHQTGALVSSDVTVVDAIPVTTVTRTLLDLAAVVSADIVEECLDDALRRGMTTVRRIRRRLEELDPRGRAGLRNFRRLLDARDGTGAVPRSALETRFLREVRRARLPLPVRQYQIRHENRVVAVADFAYPDRKIAIEVDGYRWHSGRRRWEHDLERRNALTALGWRVIHVTAADLRRPAAIIRTVEAARRGAGGSPTPGARRPRMEP